MGHRVHDQFDGVRVAGEKVGAKKDQEQLKHESISNAVKAMLPQLEKGQTAFFCTCGHLQITVKSTKNSRANNGEFIAGEHIKADLRFDKPFITSNEMIISELKKHSDYGKLFWTAEDQVERERQAAAGKVRDAIKTLNEIPKEVRELVTGDLKDLNVASFPEEALK
jgi:hypothetical protein